MPCIFDASVLSALSSAPAAAGSGNAAAAPRRRSKLQQQQQPRKKKKKKKKTATTTTLGLGDESCPRQDNVRRSMRRFAQGNRLPKRVAYVACTVDGDVASSSAAMFVGGSASAALGINNPYVRALLVLVANGEGMVGGGEGGGPADAFSCLVDRAKQMVEHHSNKDEGRRK